MLGREHIIVQAPTDRAENVESLMVSAGACLQTWLGRLALIWPKAAICKRREEFQNTSR